MIDNGDGTGVDVFMLFYAHDDDYISGWGWLDIGSIDIAGLVSRE